jgi:hypothetical protein
MAECYVHLHKNQQALNKLNLVIEHGNKFTSLAYLKKISLLIEMKMYKEAAFDVEVLLRKNEGSSEIYYLKGLVSYYLKDKNTAIIFLETCLNASN